MELAVSNELFNNIDSMMMFILVKNRMISNIMQKKGDAWIADVSLDDGEYIYKLMINEGLKINDINAYDYKKWRADEVWSVLKIQDGQVVKGNHTDISVSGYSMSPGIKCGQYLSNRCFSPKVDERYSISIDLEGLSHIHSVTAVWYREDGSIYHMGEKDIECPDGEYTYKANVVFWMDVPKEITNNNNWTVEIYVDGKKMITDYFRSGGINNVKFNSVIKNYTLFNRWN